MPTVFALRNDVVWIVQDSVDLVPIAPVRLPVSADLFKTKFCVSHWNVPLPQETCYRIDPRLDVSHSSLAFYEAKDVPLYVVLLRCDLKKLYSLVVKIVRDLSWVDIVLLVQVQDVVVVKGNADRFSCTICNVRVTVREVEASRRKPLLLWCGSASTLRQLWRWVLERSIDLR